MFLSSSTEQTARDRSYSHTCTPTTVQRVGDLWDSNRHLVRSPSHPVTLRTLPPRAGVGSVCKVLAPVFGSLAPTESQVQQGTPVSPCWGGASETRVSPGFTGHLAWLKWPGS